MLIERERMSNAKQGEKRKDGKENGMSEEKQLLRKVFCSALLLVGMVCFLTGCQEGNGKKIREIPYTVLRQEELPEKVEKIIEAKKRKPMMESYADRGWLYLMRGYGEQKTGGYSVVVKECYETSKEICFRTELLGPERKEDRKQGKTCPYLVIKLEQLEKEIRFQ